MMLLKESPILTGTTMYVDTLSCSFDSTRFSPNNYGQEEKECWCWKKAPPNSMKPVQTEHIEEDGSVVIKRRRAQTISARERLLKGMDLFFFSFKTLGNIYFALISDKNKNDGICRV